MTRRLRILMIAACPFPHSRGTPIRIRRLATALSERGHDVEVVTYHLGHEAGDSPFVIHRTGKLPTYRKTSPGPSYQKLLVLDPLLLLKTRQVLRQSPFDVIHAHHFEGLLIALAARSRGDVPIVFDSHTLLESELPHYGLGLPHGVKRSIGRRLDHTLPARADHVIAVTEVMRERLIAGGGARAGNIDVIPNGVEVAPFDRIDTDLEAERPGGEPRRVIFTGGLAPYQGIGLLLEAFRALRELRDDVVLRIVTEDPWEPYAAQARLLGIEAFVEVHRVGFEEVPGLLASADVALNPRVDCDGLPQKVLNYMAAGKPVVSFAGSATHLVDQKHGLVVPDADTEAFARAIDRLLSDRELSGTLGAAGRALVRSELSWENAGASVEAVYRRLL